MGGTKWEEVKKRFEEAVQLEGSERESLLASVRLASPAVFDEVARLLSGYQQLESSAQTFILNRDLRTDLPFAPTLVRTFEPGEVIADRYEVKRFIAKGGMGVVYEVDDRELSERVALKTLRPEFAADPTTIELFRREIRLSRRVANNSHVCHVFDVGWHRLAGEPTSDGQKGLMFLTMELLGGETLADRLNREIKIPPAEALSLARQMADGLTALHEAHVIHRDFKPSNVMLVPVGDGSRRAVVTDFGLARTIPRKEAGETAESVGPPRFTRDYVAPEQLTAEQVSPASDVFAFGVTLFEMVTGKRPFDAANDIATLIRRFSDPPSPKEHEPDLDDRWEQAILKCLRRHPGERYQSPRDVVRALEGEETEEDRPSVSGWVRAALAAAASLLIAGLVWQIPTVRNTTLDQACQWFPGSALVCRLPEDKDLAILPFENLSEGPRDRAYGDGLVSHLSEGLYWLVPDKESMCVHVREDRNAFGVKLVLTGEVARAGDQVTFRARIRDANGGNVLRELHRRVAASDARTIYSGLLRDLARALELEIPEERWRAWDKQAPSDVRALAAYLEGLGLMKREAYEQAAEAFVLGIDRDFAFAANHARLGDAYRLLYNATDAPTWAKRARNAYNVALGLTDSLPQTFFGLGQLEISQGQYEEAVQRLEQALALDPYAFDARRQLAVAYEAMNRLDEAERVNLETAQQQPQCWYVHNHVGLFQLFHGRYTEAERHFLRVIQLANDNGTAYNNLAFLYVKLGRYPDAIRRAGEAIGFGEGGMAYFNLGRAYFFQGCYSDAVTALERAAQLVPEEPRILAHLGQAYQATPERVGEARHLFERAVALGKAVLAGRPDDLMTIRYHALNLARLGNRTEATDVIERALELAPHNPEMHFFRGLVRELSGDRSGALASLRNALKLGYSLLYIISWPELSSLRSDPKFHFLVHEIGIVAELDPGSTSGTEASASCPSEQTRPEPRTGMPSSVWTQPI